jgi:hypothetical protein
LYDSAALERSPRVRPGPAHWRLYVCKCSHFLESSTHDCNALDTSVPALFDEGDSRDGPPAIQWGCQGHPLIALPHDLDGVLVATHDDLREVAVRGLRDVWPPRVRALEAFSGAWLAHLHARLAPPEAAVVTAAALDCLEDPALHTRALALRLLYRRPGEEARVRLVELLASRRALFAGVPDEFGEPGTAVTLEHTAWRIVGPLLAGPGPARDLARATLEDGTAVDAVRALLKKHDRSWLEERERKEHARLAALEPRPLDDPRLQELLEVPSLREPLASKDTLLARYLRAAGAFAHEVYEEVTYTDWDGTPVGRGTGELLRAAIAPDPALPFAELAPLLERGPMARALVARHPSTPATVLARLAEDSDAEVRQAARLRLGAA